MNTANGAQKKYPQHEWLRTLEHEGMLYYNISMDHHYHHGHRHHHPGHVHPPASVQASILRLSAAERLGIAAGLIAILWAAVFWALR